MMNPLRRWLRALVACGILLLAAAPPAALAAADSDGSAFINDDGTLKVEGRTIRLFGIHIPTTPEDCRTFERPVKCAPRAALALDFKIDSHGVHCEHRSRNRDRSITAVCTTDGENLSLYLLGKGLAVALPDAPIEYVTRERIARHRNLGIWGLRLHRTRPVE